MLSNSLCNFCCRHNGWKLDDHFSGHWSRILSPRSALQEHFLCFLFARGGYLSLFSECAFFPVSFQ
jgi:hypothetical protein